MSLCCRTVKQHLKPRTEITRWNSSAVCFSGRGGVPGRQRVQPGPHQTGHFQNLPLSVHLSEGNWSVTGGVFFWCEQTVVTWFKHWRGVLCPQGGPYHDLLHSVLGAYTCYRPDIGYVSLLLLPPSKPEQIRLNLAGFELVSSHGDVWCLMFIRLFFSFLFSFEQTIFNLKSQISHM